MPRHPADIPFENTCLGCGAEHHLSAANQAGEAPPVVGDVGACWECGLVGVYDQEPLGWVLRRPQTGLERQRCISVAYSFAQARADLLALGIPCTPVNVSRRIAELRGT